MTNLPENIPSAEVNSQDISNINKAFEVEQDLSSHEESTTKDDSTSKNFLDENDRRKEQSRYDKLYSEYQNTLRNLEAYREKASLLEEISTNEELLQSFIAEVKPDLIPKKDITSLVQERLKKEFGDYQPKQEEIYNPESNAWLYFKRRDEIYEELKNHQSTPIKKVTELKKERQEAIKEQLTKLKTIMKWDDNSLTNFQKWANSLDIVELGKMYNFAIRTMRIPEGAILGKNIPPSTARQSFLKIL